MIVLLRSEITRYSISVRTELASDLPMVMEIECNCSRC